MRLIDADALIAKELEQKEYWMSRGHGDGGQTSFLGHWNRLRPFPPRLLCIVRTVGNVIRQDVI